MIGRLTHAPRLMNLRGQPVVDKLGNRHKANIRQNPPLPERSMHQEIMLQPIPGGQIPHYHAELSKGLPLRTTRPLPIESLGQRLQLVTPKDSRRRRSVDCLPHTATS